MLRLVLALAALFYKFLSSGVSDNNYARYTDPMLDELYRKQSRAVDLEERTLQWHRIVPHSAKLRGWTITPSHFLNQQLGTVWLAE